MNNKLNNSLYLVYMSERLAETCIFNTDFIDSLYLHICIYPLYLEIHNSAITFVFIARLIRWGMSTLLWVVSMGTVNRDIFKLFPNCMESPYPCIHFAVFKRRRFYQRVSTNSKFETHKKHVCLDEHVLNVLKNWDGFALFEKIGTV